MTTERRKGKRPVKEVRKELLALLQGEKSTDEIRIELERNLSNEVTFGGLTHIWGPLLHQRAPKVFRSFILRHFSTVLVEKNWRYTHQKWTGEVAKHCEPWLNQVDSEDDVELFKRLYSWKSSHLNYKKATKLWRDELLERLRKAPDRRARQTELSKLDLWFHLDQETSIALYQMAPYSAPSFILKHLPRDYSLFSGEKRIFWEQLADLSLKNENEEFYFQLYRQQIPVARWKDEVVEMARREQDTSKLLDQLKQRHPVVWSKDLGEVYHELLSLRGRELFPYIVPELRRVHRGWFGTGSLGKLLKLAEEKNWLVLWAGLLRACARPKDYNSAVIECTKLPDGEGKKRLLLLAGIGQEWNFGALGLATFQPLSDEAALGVYQRFPELLRGVLKSQLVPSWSNIYQNLFNAILKQNDEELLDYLSSRVLTQTGYWTTKKWTTVTEKLTAHYEALKDNPPEFARRAARVIGQVPAYAFWNYGETIRANKLARLLYERSTQHLLASPEALLDLLEAPEIHAQLLAYRVLSQDDPKAVRIAKDNLVLLLGTLLRPIHRKTRVVAFKALRNAAQEFSSAEQILYRCREALHLPDKRYPKDDLIGLIATILHHHPSLRSPEEQPVIFGAPAC